MKKLFLLGAILFIAFTTKVQELNFEETVKYIQKKLEKNRNFTYTRSGKNILFATLFFIAFTTKAQI